MTNRHDLAALIEAHQKGVWLYLRLLGCDPASADDLTQETFLAVLQRPLQDHGHAAAAAYLRTIARRKWAAHVNVRRPIDVNGITEQAQAFQAADQTWEGHVAGNDVDETLVALERCLQALTEHSRRAIDLCYRERLSRADMSKRLEISESGATMLLQRAKQTLRECIKKRLGR